MGFKGMGCIKNIRNQKDGKANRSSKSPWTRARQNPQQEAKDVRVWKDGTARRIIGAPEDQPSCQTSVRAGQEIESMISAMTMFFLKEIRVRRDQAPK